MALRDYAELDEDDFYGQGFGKEGVVSIWIGLSKPGSVDPKADILQDLCGVGYYSLDQQEVEVLDKLSTVEELLARISYSGSFVKAVSKAFGNVRGHWLVAQYDFKYDPKKVKRKIAKDPRFVGAFKYSVKDEE